jgi:pimeloyl-ACP methyl ester carboxylesterase
MSDQQPGRYYLWDRTRQRSTLLFTMRPELEHQPLVPMTPVEIAARDGLTLVSYLSLPASAARGRDGRPSAALPMVLLVHGGPWSRDHWGYHALHQLLANRGYAVLSVNYRGSTGFGRSSQRSKSRVGPGDARRPARRRRVGDLARVTTKDRAASWSGAMAATRRFSMAMTPDVFRCGVDVGPSNLLTFLATIPDWAPAVARCTSGWATPGRWTAGRGWSRRRR